MSLPGLMRVLDSRSRWAMLVAGLAGAFLLMIAVRSVMSHPPMYDELLHVLAARGVVATGEPVILDGAYRRAELFTRLVALVYEWRGESLWAARLPALLSGMVLMLLTGAWVTRHAGFLAGATASVLLAATATTIELSAFARFYTLHALVIFVLYVSAFNACAPDNSRRVKVLWSLLALAAVPLAGHLQKSTLIGVGASAAGVVSLIALDRWIALRAAFKRRPGTFLLATVGLAIVGVMLARRFGIDNLAEAAPLWAAGRSDDVGFYIGMLGREWPLFWALIPLGALAAITEFRRFGLFCTVVALAAIAVHSVAAAKAMRYVYYAMPFLCAVVGCGVAVSVKLLGGWIGKLRGVNHSGWATVAAILLIAAVVANSQEARLAARFLTGKASWTDLAMFASEADWSAAVPVLRAHLGRDSTLVVSSAVKGVYYLGDYDYELNASTVLESESLQEFGLDRRTGRQVIGTRGSLAQVLDRSRQTLLVVDADKVGKASGVSVDVVELIASRCAVLEVPAESRVRAWTCRHI